MTSHSGPAAVVCRVTFVIATVLCQFPSAADERGTVVQRPVLVPTDTAYYVGINERFGRWPEGVVRWSYNPSGAPARYRSTASFVPLVERAMQMWENVCGIRFEYIGPSRRSIDDSTDGVVTVGWVVADPDGAAAWAGPEFPPYFDRSLAIRHGYLPYVDGLVAVNSRSQNSSSSDLSPDDAAEAMVAIIAHEIGHLIGLGHSDDPASILYANPYSHFRTLRDDDVDAAQALYGPSSQYSAPERFTSPGPAEPIDSLLSSVVDGTGATVSRVTRSTRGPIWFKVDYRDELNGIIQYKVVDEDGYVVDSHKMSLRCKPQYTCVQRAYIGDTEQFLVRPGTLQLYVFLGDHLVDVHSLEVDGKRHVNRMPAASLELDSMRGRAPLTVTARLQVRRDPEGDRVSGSWHVPGEGETDFIVPRSGLDTERQLTFVEPGRYEIFVSLTDDAPRYGDPDTGSGQGAGFRRLLAAVVEVY